jgi:hypothetical protein
VRALIVDCHTHFWETLSQLGREVDGGNGTGASRAAVLPPNAGTERHFANCAHVDYTFVLAFRSHYLGAEIPNDLVAQYVRQHPEKLIGFAGIDPNRPREAVEEMRRARHELGMLGCAIAPAAQDFHPCDSKAEVVYQEAAALRMPLIFHPGVRFARLCKLEYSRPFLLDEIARELPDLKILIAHMGYPWVPETIVLLAKHPNVFADVSRLMQRPWEAYQALLSAYQYGVTDKLLFASGFPFSSAAQAIEALYSINRLVHETNLPTIPREELRKIVEADALGLLGITVEGAVARGERSRLLDDEN